MADIFCEINLIATIQIIQKGIFVSKYIINTFYFENPVFYSCIHFPCYHCNFIMSAGHQ